jgi:hypothetical protein
MRDSGTLYVVEDCASKISERRSANSPANSAQRTSLNTVEGSNSPLGGLSGAKGLSYLGNCHRANQADVPACREVHDGVETFHSSTERPNVGRGRPALPYVCLISLVIVPRYARGCPATVLSSKETPVNSTKSCCLASNLKEGDVNRHEIHGMSPRPGLSRDFPNIRTFCLTYCLS